MTSETQPVDLAPLVSAAETQLLGAATMDELKAAEAAHLGKKGAITAVTKQLGRLDPEQRKAIGAKLTDARRRLEALAGGRRAVLAEQERAVKLEAERLDLTEVAPPTPPRGSLQLVTQAQQRLEDVFVAMGYQIAEGPEAETDWHNFTALNFPEGHPARDGFDSLYLELGMPGSILLRTHTSPVQVRVMLEQGPPIYAVMPGKVYRKDTPDARHLPNFSQIEGLVIDEGITFADLAGTIETFTHAYFGPNISARLRPAFFPFTEPSAEFEITCTICDGVGCRTCSGTGWIELGGCGMVHPNVLRFGGIDPERYTGFAFGFGIDRLAQMRHNIADMRVLLDNDLRFTTQF